MAAHDLRQLLVDLGYHVVDRTDTWCECFVANETERWRGKGLTAQEAVADVIAQMLPSELGRHLLERFDQQHAAAHMPPMAPPIMPPPSMGPSTGTTTPPLTPPPATPMSFVVRAAATSPISGKTLPHQAVLAMPQRGMIALVDGGKPTVAGGTAARMTVQTLTQVLESTASLTPLRMRGLPGLLGAIQRANREIHEAAKKDSKLKAMQASVAAVLTAGGQVAIVRVGSATVHRLRDGAIEKLLDSTDGKGERLGADRLVEVETTMQPARAGDMFVVSPCSGQALGASELAELLETSDLDAALSVLRKPQEQGAWAGAVLRIEAVSEPSPTSVSGVASAS